MEPMQQSKQHIEQVARDALDQFDKIATAAQAAIRNAPNLGTDTLAAVNTLTGGAAVQRLGQINQENLESYQVLAREPTIARVLAAVLHGHAVGPLADLERKRR